MIEFAPEIGFAAGAAAGSALELIAHRRIVKNDAAMVEAWGGINETPSRMQRIARVVISPLVLISAPIAAYNAAVWQPEPGPETTPPYIGLVIDHSGATATAANKPIDEINKVAKALQDNNLEVHAIVARAGDVRAISSDNVAADEAFGDALLYQGMQAAFDDETAMRQRSVGKQNRQSIGTVVITNGNTIGVPEDIIAKAKVINTAVNVVNVEGKGADPATIQGLQDIAEQTGGKYWDADANTATEVTRDVKHSLTDNLVKSNGNQGNWRDRALGLAMLVGIPLMFGKRRNEARNLSKLRMQGRK